MLIAENITKKFDTYTALNNISLTLQEGSISGLIGTNGAGKSTLLRVLTGTLHPEAGKVTLDGQSVWHNPAAMQDLCYLSDEPTFLNGATIATMNRMQKAYFANHDEALLKTLCDHFDLNMDSRIASMSKGTQKRVQICLGLARRPKVLLCDETFDGLDPIMRDRFRKELSRFTLDTGMTTVLASHQLQEMEGICDSVAILHQSTLINSGNMDTVCEAYTKVQCVVSETQEEALLKTLAPVKTQRQGRLMVLTLHGDRASMLQTLQAAAPQFMEEIPMTLTEIFMLEMEEKGYVQ